MSLRKKVSEIRIDYTRGALDISQVASDPMVQFERWFEEAVSAEVLEPNAMTLGTVSEGQPSARVVLLKGFDDRGFVFYTNYDSRKAAELEEEPRAALTFFWPELQRQIRIEGTTQKAPESESNAYYASRGRGSRIGAWASPQSRPIKSREYLENLVQQFSARFEGQTEIPRPDYWGGYLLRPAYLEFWQGRPSRLHDRIIYRRVEETWKLSRIAP